MSDIGAFIDSVRASQREGGKSLAGPNRLLPTTLTAIRQVATELFKPTSDGITPELAAQLGERFEEMCRRQKQSISPNQREDLQRYLVAELKANCAVLDMDPKKLVSVTIYWGAICSFLPTEFADFADTPGIFKRAAVGYPTDPRGFLRQVQTDIATMAQEPEFADFTDMPSIFKYAAVHYPSDPRRFLRQVQTDIVTMAKEPEFADFADTPGIFKYAAVSNPSDPRRFLRQVQTDIVTMAKEPEFADFTDIPSIFKRAAAGYPTDPRGFLRRAQRRPEVI